MLSLYDLGLLNGEYVVVTIETLPDSCKATASTQDGRDAEACKAYEGVIEVSQYIPDSQEYEDFTFAVYNRMPEMNYTMNAPNEVSISITNYYFATCQMTICHMTCSTTVFIFHIGK